MLQRVHTLLPIIVKFLAAENNTDFPELLDEEWLNNFAFAVDILPHLNDLNTNLQGKDQFVFDMLGHINDFMDSLQNGFQNDIESKKFESFPTLKQRKKLLKDNHLMQYKQILTDLRADFDNRFQDFRKIEPLINCVANPFECDFNKLTDAIVACLGRLRNDDAAKQLYAEGDIVAFYAGLADDIYFELKAAAYLIFVIFGSTYLCESTFSTMKLNKSDGRAQLTDSHLEAILRISTTSVDVNYDELARQKQTLAKKYA